MVKHRQASRRTGKLRQSDRQRSRIAHPTSANFEPLEQRALMTASNLVISEFLAINNTGLKDQDNAFSDWIEIRNRSVSEQSLNGWHLTDNDNNLVKWTFPDVSIPAGGYLVVFASGKDRHVNVPGNELHTNFSLSGGGEIFGPS